MCFSASLPFSTVLYTSPRCIQWNVFRLFYFLSSSLLTLWRHLVIQYIQSINNLGPFQAFFHTYLPQTYTRVQKFNHTSYSLLNKPPWYSELWDGQGRVNLFVSWRSFLLCPWHLLSQFSRFSRKMDFWEKLSNFD